MTMKPTFALLALILFGLLAPDIALCQAGKSGMAFLKLGVSGRGVSMADAMSATVYGAAATYYNPAGMLTLSEGSSSTQLLLMHKEWIQDARTEFLGTATLLDTRTALGLSINTTTVSDIDIRTVPGSAVGTFSSRDFALGLSFAYSVSEEFRAGITGKFLFQKILVDQSSGFAFDFGAQYTTSLEGLVLGATLANIGSVSELRNESPKLPLLLRIGPAYSMELTDIASSATVAGDVVHLFSSNQSTVNLGGEFLFRKRFAGRLGYQFGSESRGFSTGVGVTEGIFMFDYAFAPLSSDLGKSHTFSLALNF